MATWGELLKELQELTTPRSDAYDFVRRRALNDLYKHEWSLFYNLFIPSFKLISKERIKSKIIKKHDDPKTPYLRVLESEFIPEETKDQLRQIYKSLNPFDLKKIIANKLDKITRNSRIKFDKQIVLR